MRLHSDLTQKLLTRETKLGMAIALPFLLMAAPGCLMLFSVLIGLCITPAAPIAIIILARITARIVTAIRYDLEAFSWKLHLTNSYANSAPKWKLVEVTRLPRQFYGDPLYPIDVPLRSYAKELLKVSVQNENGMEELDFFTLLPLKNEQWIFSAKEAKAFLDESGRIMCIEVGDFRLWRSLHAPRARRTMMWGLLEYKWLTIEIPTIAIGSMAPLLSHVES